MVTIETILADAAVAEREIYEVADVAEHGEYVADAHAAWLADGGIDELAAAHEAGTL